jgi:hypothetical protein
VIQPRTEQAAHLFGEIASIAATADRAIYYGPLPHEIDSADSAERMQLHIDALRSMICRIGWMADLGLEALGNGVVRGGAEEWLLGPLFPKLAAEVSQ